MVASDFSYLLCVCALLIVTCCPLPHTRVFHTDLCSVPYENNVLLRHRGQSLVLQLGWKKKKVSLGEFPLYLKVKWSLLDRCQGTVPRKQSQVDSCWFGQLLVGTGVSWSSTGNSCWLGQLLAGQVLETFAVWDHCCMGRLLAGQVLETVAGWDSC